MTSIVDLQKDNINCVGYYNVGDRVYKDKIAAFMYGTQSGHQPQWNFNNEAFNKFNWLVEPTETIDELYRIRAQEIRDTYDYVALSYSGGADSHQVLMAFLQNNIRLDEIIVTWPIKRSERLGADPNDLSCNNFISEWELALKPRLKWLSHHYPQIKINITDWTEDLERVPLPDEMLMNRGNMLSMYAFLRYNRMSDVGRIHGMDGVILYGMDKPRICIHDGYYNITFIDVIAQTCFAYIDDRISVNELFFWNPKSCKIMAKQAHTIVKFAEMTPAFKSMLHWPHKAYNRQTYEATVKPLIYPSTDTTQFQTNKPDHTNISMDAVVMNSDLEARYMIAYQRNWAQLQTVIDAKYFHQHVDGHTSLTGCINGMWKIAPA